MLLLKIFKSVMRVNHTLENSLIFNTININKIDLICVLLAFVVSHAIWFNLYMLAQIVLHFKVATFAYTIWCSGATPVT